MALFGTFLWQVIRQWLSFMSCAAFTFLGLYLTKYPQTPHWIYWANGLLAVLFLLVAAFHVWKEQHELLAFEVAKNANPTFAIEPERIVYSNGNSHMFVLCSVVNLSEKKAGLRTATLSDSRLPVGERYRADEVFKSATLYIPNENRITVSGNEQGRVTAESIGILRVESLLKVASPLLTQGVRETGWFAFAGVGEPGNAKPETFRLQIKDTLGGLHDSLITVSEIERRQIL